VRFGGPGRFLKDVPCGLAGPWGREIQRIEAPLGSDHGFGGPRTTDQKVEDMWICRSVHTWIYRTDNPGLDIILSQPGGPLQGGAGGYTDQMNIHQQYAGYDLAHSDLNSLRCTGQVQHAKWPVKILCCCSLTGGADVLDTPFIMAIMGMRPRHFDIACPRGP
jgi:hypothetical protein